MNSNYFYAISALFNGLFGAFLVYYVYLRNRSNPLNQSFLFFGLSVSGWSLGYSIWAFAPNAEFAERAVRTHMMFEAFIPATFFHFCTQFTGHYEKFRRWIQASYFVSLAYAIGMQTPLLIAGVKPMMFFQYWPVRGPLLLSHVIYFMIFLNSGLGFLIYRVIKSSGMERQQTIWVLAAVAIGFGGGSINWLPWFDINVPPTTNFFVGLMFAIMAFAIVRHGVMDADMVIEFMRSSRAAMLGLLAGSQTHELRGPLYITRERIAMHMENIEAGQFQDPAAEVQKSREVLTLALKNLGKAADIMQRFSKFAWLPRTRHKAEVIALEEVVSDVRALVSFEIRFDPITIRTELAEKLQVHANRQELEEIIFNLVFNACQAMRGQGGQLKILSRPEKGKVALEISDTGPGIEKENLRRIFDPFYSTKTRGMGLGLYITKQLVERNGGRIFVHSKPGKGTRFTLEFKQ